ncbi:MAG: CHAT domain-containing protein [Cyanobacteria bacterium P01_D01_bin.56]
MIHSRNHTVRATFLALLLFTQQKTTQAQTVITPTNDGTGTLVNQTGPNVNIEAGSRTGSNLFHSFSTFQLTPGTTANFLTNPSTERIFARITSSNGTFIDGRLRIIGAPANLYLLNPNGIIFGPNATLALPADLTATTADRINFDNGSFKAFGSNNYSALAGPPTAFAFDQAGTIRNEGDLVLPSGRLTLLSGNIIDAGSLTADNLQIAEVENGDIIRVSQTGTLLNLEFSSDSIQNSSAQGNVTSTNIPGLLTNGGDDHASQIVMDTDGQLLLTDASAELEYGQDPDGDYQARNGDPSSDPANGEYKGERSSDRTDTSATEQQDSPSDENTESGRAEDRETKGSRSGEERLPRHVHRAALGISNGSAVLEEIETLRNQEFSDYFGRDLRAKELTLPEIQDLLTQVHNETGNRSVIVYIKTPKLTTDLFEQTATALELLIFTSSGEPVSLVLPNVTQEDLFRTVEEFRRALVASSRNRSKRYLPTAQTLYQWLIKPIEDELGPEAMDTLLFSMDSGLRTVPIAALHDGQQFLIEKYAVGMVPSLGLMNPNYKSLGKAQVLAMGASNFETLQPLPAVPAELETIDKLWPSRKFLNETFTQQNLIDQQQQTPAQIIHLATHAEFKAGSAEESYIQLWNERLRLSDIHTLGWDSPMVDLLVLSACRTALGDTDAEMGFAGLAVASGVRSALASLWTVSDVGTLALMSEFYHQLMDNPTKSDALRTAQLAMLKGETRLEEKQLPIENTQLPEDLQGDLDRLDLSHPYFWAGFTLIGSPW